MTVGLRVGNIIDELGDEGFLHSFFSSISFHLEPKGWGTVYPELMNELYQGKLEFEKAEKARNDLREIKEKFKLLSPDRVVWDIENQKLLPPWRDSISKDITDLSKYFITSAGKNLFDVFLEALDEAIDTQEDVFIELL